MSPRGPGEARPSPGAIAPSSRTRLRTCLRTMIVLVGGCGAVWWLARTVWDETRPARATIRAIRSGDSAERVEAIRELETTGLGDGWPAIPPLIAALADADARVRSAAAIALGPIGTDALGPVGIDAVTSGPGVDEVRAAITGLLGAMEDPEPAVRIAATRSLGSILAARNAAVLVDPKALIAALVERLGDRDAGIRLAALQVLAAAESPAGVDTPMELDAALRDESAGNRAMAVTALARFPRGLEPRLPTVFAMLEHDDDSAVRAACVRAMEDSRTAISAAAVPSLVAALGRPDRRVRSVACSLLMRLGSEARAAIPALIATARTRSGDSAAPDSWLWDPQSHAIDALGRIAPGTESAGAAVAALTELLRDEGPFEDASNWRRVVFALEPLGAAAAPAIPELIRRIRTSALIDTPFDDHSSLAKALGRIAPGTAEAGQAIVALTEALRSKSPMTSSAAASALRRFGPQSAIAIPRLRALTKDPEALVRRAAEEALAELTKTARHRDQ